MDEVTGRGAPVSQDPENAQQGSAVGMSKSKSVSEEQKSKAKKKSSAKPEEQLTSDEKLSAEGEDPQKMMARATAEANAAFGTLISLMLQSEMHQFLFLQDLKWAVVPPLLQRQFRLFRVRGIPVGYLIWASVSEEVEQRLETGQMKLQPNEWGSGDRLWVMDILLPPQLPEAMLPMITEGFDDPSGVKILVTGEDGNLTTSDLASLLQERVIPAQDTDKE